MLSLGRCTFSVARQAGHVGERQLFGNILNSTYRNGQRITEKETQEAEGDELSCKAQAVMIASM